MINPIYILSEEQRKLAEKIGRARCEAKDAKFRYNDSGFHSYNNDRSFPHILGICAEIAYSDLLDRKFDENIYAKGDESDFDGIELKTSTWKGNDIELKIKVSEFKRKHPKAYILARIDKDYTTVEFIGSISRQKFDRIKYLKKHKFVENYCVNGDQISKGLVYVENDKLRLFEFQK